MEADKEMREEAPNEVPPVEEVEDAEGVLDVDPEQEVMPVSYDITSFGIDYPVDGLVKRLGQGDVVVPSFDPQYDEGEVRAFQRRFVWTRPQMDKFVESLLLGLPVPGIFLVRETGNRLLVLDGQQRLRTLLAYYRGVHADKTFRLQYAQAPFAGKTYEELEAEDRRRLDDSVIHATVLRQEIPTGSQDAVYSIFERLNTGGSPLQPQEIRVALYNGPFLRMISNLNEDTQWRSLYGPRSARFKDQELILRVLALYERPERYERPVKQFLNGYLSENRMRPEAECAEVIRLFRSAAATLQAGVGSRAFRPVRALNAAVLDSTMVGMMTRLQQRPIEDINALGGAYDNLIVNPDYLGATTSSTAAEDTVKLRLRLAIGAFENVA